MEVATGATSRLLLSLGGLLQEEYKLQDKVRRDIECLQTELLFMQATLRKVAAVPREDLDELVQIWADLLREVSYDMEDVLNNFSVRGTHLDGFIGRVFNMVRMGSKHHRIAGMIEENIRLVKQVSELRDKYRLDDSISSSSSSTRAQRYHNTALFAADHQEITRRLIAIKEPVGAGEVMEKLENWITSGGNHEVSILSIYGFSGVGKTAAAMALYRRCGVQFKRRAMVTVSHNTDPLVILRQILRQLVTQVQGQQAVRTFEEKHQAVLAPLRMLSRASQIGLCFRNQDEDSLEKEHYALTMTLMEYLQNDRYLLLIDDVWSSSMWQTILNILPRNSEGSRIILTTRFEAVAMTSLTDHDHLHRMKTLSDVDAESLFEKSLSECRGTEGSQNGQVPPRRVWEICGGLPLPIVTMAGLVASNKQTNPEWLEICENLFPEKQVCHKPEEFMRIINYCYNVLPSDLKTCCLYFSIFPKGRKISKKRLMRRWISEGFISEKQGLSVEDVAETCFNQLIKRQIIRPVEHSTDGKVKSCQVHDMVLEYIISKAGEENFVTVVGGQWSTPTRSNKVRRMSLHSSGSKHASKADRMNLSHVRSLTLFGSLYEQRFKSFKTGIVQVLDLEGCSGLNKHASVSDVCEMTLLKYLSLRGTDVDELPSNIGDLKYLETLDVRQTGVEELPKTVVLLERISNILGGDKRTRKALKLPKQIKNGAMKTLRVLSGIEITDGSTAVSNLHNLTGLRKLAIYKLHQSDQLFADLLSSIRYLCGYSLQSLVIDDESSEFHQKLGTMLTPPAYLSALELSGKLLELPAWIPKLRDIVKLTLSATVLQSENLECLLGLKTLFSLTFSTCAEKHDLHIVSILQKNKSEHGGEIFVPAGGFENLKLFRVFVPLLPSLNFSEGAMPALERLELSFKRLEGLHGIGKLEHLHDVILKIDGEAENPTKSIIDDLKEAADGKYALDINQ